MNDDIPSCKLGMTDSPSPSDTPALTEGRYAEIAASLRQEAETRDKFSDYFDAELTAEMFAGAAAITALLARAEAAEKRVEKLEHSDKEWGRLHQAVIMERAEALIALEAAEKERDDLQQNVWALESKVSALSAHESCACSWDRAGDVCLHHSPKLVAAQARIDALTAEVARLRDKCESGAALLEVVSDNARDRDDINTWSMTSVMAANLRAALSPVKQEPNDG